MARHRPDRRKVKIHWPYTVEEIARLLGTCRATVRRWIKQGLPTIDGGRPIMVRGADLLEFLNARAKPKQPCPVGQCYCVKCRSARAPADRKVEFVVLTATTGNLRGRCPDCGTLMHRRTSLTQLQQVRTLLEVTVVEATRRLRDSTQHSTNVHFNGA
jgi:excisionase family DNA binding protein